MLASPSPDSPHRRRIWQWEPLEEEMKAGAASAAVEEKSGWAQPRPPRRCRRRGERARPPRRWRRRGGRARWWAGPARDLAVDLTVAVGRSSSIHTDAGSLHLCVCRSTFALAGRGPPISDPHRRWPLRFGAACRMEEDLRSAPTLAPPTVCSFLFFYSRSGRQQVTDGRVPYSSIGCEA